jgi:methyltransferase
MLIVILVMFVVFATMLVEACVSRAHENKLRAAGAVEPPGDVFGVMRIAYPASFLLMALEALLRGPSTTLFVLGLLIFAFAKALKWWAIASLGDRWSFRVLVLPSHALVDAGPYRVLRHPNYVGVFGELVAVALMLSVPWTGTLACVGFGALIRVRIRIEERALGLGGDAILRRRPRR